MEVVNGISMMLSTTARM